MKHLQETIHSAAFLLAHKTAAIHSNTAAPCIQGLKRLELIILCTRISGQTSVGSTKAGCVSPCLVSRHGHFFFLCNTTTDILRPIYSNVNRPTYKSVKLCNKAHGADSEQSRYQTVMAI